MNHEDRSVLQHAIKLIAVVLLAHASPSQAGQTTKVYGIAVSYADTRPFKRGPETLQKILRKVRDFYAEGSGGMHEFVGEVHPTPLELPQGRPAGKCQLPAPASVSAALREAGVNLDGYHALVLVAPPSELGCPGGVQTILHHREADGSTRRIPLAVSWSLTDRYIAHEIVHTHGVGHANALACRGASLAINCKTREYGNAWDLMGQDGGGLRMISAPLRAHMGWPGAIVHGSGSATYTIGAATRPGSLPSAVQVRLPIAGNDPMTVRQPLSLWIEYRAPHGFDQRMASFATGAMVNLTGTWQGIVGNTVRTLACPQTAPCLLDTSPQTATFADAGLAVGQTWTEPFTGTRITVESRTEATLTVSVSVK